ncbi:hypothetical protein BGV40_03850 [Methanosarcina sp. Ant1]|nr:hypothetical protein BGV40_03850 [Methanosarcina sp. Ant1]
MEAVKYRYTFPEFESKLEPIQYFAEKFLRFIPRNIPDYPSHGVDHSIKIIEHIDSVIEKWPLTLHDEEIYLLYLGAWLHDIGNIIDRKEHNIHSAYIINKSPILESYLGRTIQNQLAWVAKAHSSSCNIMDVPIEIGNVRLRLTSSIFRILDACEIDNTKCPSEVYQYIEKSLNPESREYWESHRSILNIKFKNSTICLEVDNKEKSSLVINHLREEIESVKDIILNNEITFPVVEVIETGLY